MNFIIKSFNGIDKGYYIFSLILSAFWTLMTAGFFWETIYREYGITCTALFSIYIVLTFVFYPFSKYAIDTIFGGAKNQSSSGGPVLTMSYSSYGYYVLFMLVVKFALYLLVFNLTFIFAPIGMLFMAKHADNLHKTGQGKSFSTFGYELNKTTKDQFLKDHPEAEGSLQQLTDGFKYSVDDSSSFIPHSKSMSTIYNQKGVMQAICVVFPNSMKEGIINGFLTKYDGIITDRSEENGEYTFEISAIGVQITKLDEIDSFMISYLTVESLKTLVTEEAAAVKDLL